MAVDQKEPLYGLMAEFETPEALASAARRAREMGYTDMDAYSPFPVEGLHDIISERRTRLPMVVLICGLLGAITGFGMQWYLNGINYPINVGGRPLLSWPAFIPITFELTVLFAGISAVIGLFIANRAPSLYHPVFNVLPFERASQDRFFLCLEQTDNLFDEEDTEEFLWEMEPRPTQVFEVAR